MKKICIVILLCALLIGLMWGCKVPDRAINEGAVSSYDMEIKIADNLESADIRSKITIYNGSADVWERVSLNLYANAYRKDAPQKAYAKELARYGGIEILSVKSEGVNLETELYSNLTAMNVKLPRPLEPGQKADIEAEGILTMPAANLRLGLYDKILNMGNFYPVLAVYENGAFRVDNFSRTGDPFYSEAADYKVRIVSPKNLVIAASADERTEVMGEGYKVTEIRAKKLRDFAMCASYDFKEVQGLAGDTTVRYYYTGANAPEKLLETAMNAFSLFSEKIGAYPYKSFTVAEVPFSYGGMEYSGLVYINKNASDKEEIIIHETAHQWFGCMVGSDAINYSWQDEALATFLAEYYYPLKQGEKETYTKAKEANAKAFESFVKVQRLTQPGYSLIMDKPIYNFATSHEYTMLVYVRGALMFESIYTLSGEKKFLAALKDYFEDNKFKIASPDGLYAAFKKNRKDVEPIINSWLNDKVISTASFI